ncbi:MAG: hypothetical protein AUK30_07080 [Nitrospirae bacterium CG2_30_70_394]|nr:NusG domain II-containing protein [Deltaproteobacteria bacterium]NCP97142.1 NusG domain II-containing protein [Deltaproteobacteria bacterium]OIP64167.1 MAG: hypothetical protein AUK30_07080 [Nitrospirae bacterium CG2_30_70_394]
MKGWRGWLIATRPADWLLIGLLLGAAIAGELYLATHARRGSLAEVQVDGRVVLRLPLDRPTETTVEGRLGPLTIAVAGGKVRVVEAPCRHQVCVRMGARGRAGETLVCVPSRVVICILGPRSVEGVDAVAR